MSAFGIRVTFRPARQTGLIVDIDHKVRLPYNWRLSDRVLIAVMVYSFARVTAALEEELV
jgi:hypothetical protein